MDKAEIVIHHQSTESRVANFTHVNRLGRGNILSPTKEPNDEILEQAFQERDAYNANLTAIANIRGEMGKISIRGSHETLDQLETIFVGQNNQIKKGLLTLPEIQGKNHPESRIR